MPTLRRWIKFPVFLPVNELAKSDSDFLQIRRPTAFAAESSLSFVHAIARCASDDREPDQKGACRKGTFWARGANFEHTAATTLVALEHAASPAVVSTRDR